MTSGRATQESSQQRVDRLRLPILTSPPMKFSSLGVVRFPLEPEVWGRQDSPTISRYSAAHERRSNQERYCAEPAISAASWMHHLPPPFQQVQEERITVQGLAGSGSRARFRPDRWRQAAGFLPTRSAPARAGIRTSSRTIVTSRMAGRISAATDLRHQRQSAPPAATIHGQSPSSGIKCQALIQQARTALHQRVWSIQYRCSRQVSGRQFSQVAMAQSVVTFSSTTHRWHHYSQADQSGSRR